MTDARTDTPSIAARIRAVSAGSPVVAAHFLGNVAAFVLGEEAVIFVPPQSEERRVASMPAPFLRPPRTASASSPAATTAKWRRR
ncbi:MAG: hypothetical protein M3R18_02830, partial [Pseudomonadota bacterium]|nr:hypothetical protein [Pseudomonadota bacterium]